MKRSGPWTEAEARIALEMLAAGESYAAIGERLGMNKWTIRSRIARKDPEHREGVNARQRSYGTWRAENFGPAWGLEDQANYWRKASKADEKFRKLLSRHHPRDFAKST